jgi:hypothetical protein
MGGADKPLHKEVKKSRTHLMVFRFERGVCGVMK